MLRNFAVAVPLWLALCLPLFADQVVLKNGDRLTGTIVKSDGKTLVLHTDYAGDVTLNWNALSSIHSDQPLHATLQDGKTAVGTVNTSDSTLVIATSVGNVEAPLSGVQTLRNGAEEAAYEKTLHPGFFQGWNAGLNAGYTLTAGNSETSNLAIGFNAVRQTTTDKLTAYENSVYGKNNAPGAVPSTTANTEAGGIRYDHDINAKVFAFASADFFSDALQGLNLRSVFGGGLGYHAIKSSTTTLDILAGLNYTHESYTVFTRNLAALTLGEELMHKLGKSTTITESGTFFPDLNSVGDYRATFNLGTITKMNKWLGWQNSFSDVYVTNPPPGKKTNDLILTTGLNISLTPSGH